MNRDEPHKLVNGVEGEESHDNPQQLRWGVLHNHSTYHNLKKLGPNMQTPQKLEKNLPSY